MSIPKRLITILLLSFLASCSAEETHHQVQKPSIGHRDTVLFNANRFYSYSNYEGSKPFYLQMWYPAEEDSTQQPLSYGKILRHRGSDKTRSIDSVIYESYKNSLLQYGVLNILDGWDSRPEDSSAIATLNGLLALKTSSMYAKKLPEKQYPTIIYHHGMGGSPQENLLLFERLVSLGYVVISSNYHWPEQGISMDEIAEDIEFVIAEAKDLPFVDPLQMTYIGHSWGAQMGLVVNHRSGSKIKQFILLDTTLEEMSLDMVAKYYPEFDSLISNYPSSFTTPTHVITARKGFVENDSLEVNPFPEFAAYGQINSDSIRFYVGRFLLNHDAFVSTGVLRGLLGSKYSMADSALLQNQYQNYLKVNQQVISILGKVTTDSAYFDDVRPIKRK